MPKERLRDIKRFFWYITIVFALSFMMVTFLLQKTTVLGNSMYPTLSHQDNVFVNKMIYRNQEPKRYDIIVFKYLYQDDQYYIKRIIGLPGETVQIKDGSVYIDGEPLNETYGVEEIMDPKRAKEPVTLGEDEFFVLGDNRNQSSDSRSADVGNVTRQQILGKVFMIIWPLDRVQILKHQ